MYEYLSNAYDELHGEEQLRKLSIIKAELGLSPDDSVIDVGCGTGLSSALGCKVVGVDSCEEMVEKSTARITAIKAFAEELPFPDKSFDAAICVTACHNFSDASAAVKEMLRVARNKAAISVLKKSVSLRAIEESIRKNFRVEKIIDDRTDTIYICTIRRGSQQGKAR
ncbi:class I SAM-dependent methyltransferase [Candidatus Woesearchaeota archaeon]|nr:class I SAM-dependent methyltransferase [Candidatus Woesearchaeota archaeon]